jgi:hypothetical protein
MHRSKFLTAIAALTAVAAGPAAGAMAQADAPATVPSIEITKAYAFKTSSYADGKTYAQVVFKTAGELPRRFDGMIRAGGALDGTGHSISAVRGKHGKATNCYTFLAKINDGRIAGPQGRKAGVGSRHTVKVTARGTTADISDSVSVTLRRQRPGDLSGKPLAC